MNSRVQPHRQTIIYVGGFEFPDRNAAAQRAHANALILKDLGYRVVLLGVSRELPRDSDARRVEHATLPFDCWELPYPTDMLGWLRRISEIGPVARLVDNVYRGDVAAIICYDYPAIAQERLRAYAAKRGAAIVSEVTEWYSVNRISGIASIMKNIDRVLRMRWVNRRVDGLITASAFLREFYEPTGKPILELPTLVPDDPRSGEVTATPDGEPRRLFFAGTGFDPALVAQTRDGLKDRLDKVIAALHGARGLGANFRLDVFGVTRDDYLAIVPAHASILDELEGRIEFHGRQPRAVVRSVLARADFSIFLRKKTIVTLAGFPTKYGESIHFGTPVITNAVGSIPAYHVPGKTGHYLDYDDTEAAAVQLCDILAQSAGDIAAMKKACQTSGLFHFRRYVGAMGSFLQRLRGPRDDV